MVIENSDTLSEHLVRNRVEVVGKTGSDTPRHKTRDGRAERASFVRSRCPLPKPLLDAAAGEEFSVND
jgi:hypothetical protein